MSETTMQKLLSSFWESQFKQQRLELIFRLPPKEIEFLESAVLCVRGIHDISFKTKSKWIDIKEYDFSHNFEYQPYSLLAYIDHFFIKNVALLSMDEEQTYCCNKTKEFLLQHPYKNVCTPFFYTMRGADIGFREAKIQFTPDKEFSFDTLAKVSIHKMFFTGLQRARMYENKDKILV